MVIRNLKKNKLSIRNLIFISLLLFGFILLLMKIFQLPDKNTTITDTISDFPNFIEGQDIISSGTILLDNNFPYYTHILYISETQKIGLKSTDINLNNFTNKKVEVEGTVDTIVKSMPVIKITTLKLFDENLIIKNNNYFFVNDLLNFDFSDQNGFTAIKSGDLIQILFQDLVLLNIKHTVCNQVTDTHNCTYIANTLKDKGVERFTSYLGYDFYRYGTGSWISFNKDIYSYIFTPINQDTMLDISSIMTIVDSKYLMEKKQDIIDKKCQKDGEKFDNTQISEIHMTHEGLQDISLILKGKSNKGNDVTCTLTLNLRKNRNTKNVIFSDTNIQNHTNNTEKKL